MLKYILIFLLSISTLFSLEITKDLRLNGFATFDATMAISSDVKSELPAGGFETIEDGEVVFDASVFGLQLDYAPTQNLSFAIQGALTKNYVTQEYESSLEWAYLHYDFGNNISAKIGHMKIPFLTGIELRYIGYSRLWTRPQIPPSGIIGFDDYNGVDILYKTTVQSLDLEFEFSTGQAIHEKEEEIKGEYFYLGATKVEYDDSWLRVAFGYNYFELSIPGRGIFKEGMYFASVETELNIDNFVFNGGYTYTYTETIPNDTIKYLSFAYRIDAFTPYVLLSKKELYFPKPIPVPVGEPLKEEITDDISIGVRYDLMDNTALKLQYEDRSIQSNSERSQLSSQNGGLLMFNIDMVF